MCANARRQPIELTSHYTVNHTELHGMKDRYLAGVYILYRGSSILYVGQSFQVYWRVWQHMSTGMEFDSWRVVQIDDPALRQFLETALIQVLRPDGNFDISMRNALNTFTKPKVFSPSWGENTLTVEEMQRMIVEKTGDASLIADAKSIPLKPPQS